MAHVDLGALDTTLTIKDHKGKEWKVDPWLPASEAIWFQRAATAKVEDEVIWQRTLGAIVKGFAAFDPKITADKVLESFTMQDIYVIMRHFLAPIGPQENSPAEPVATPKPTKKNVKQAVSVK